MSQRCPFCGEELDDPMQGFFDHLDDNPDCAAQYGPWRDAVRREGGK